jgi:broad specificity phosphatase PhoE
VLYLVRHGETAPNVAGALLGRSDPPLTDRGRAQAAALARLLPRPDRLVSSPLRRARDTAAALGAAVEVDERWIELDYGAFDGASPEAVPADAWRRWREDPGFVPDGGGESLAALGDRVRAACDDLVADAAAGTVVVVTHVSPVKAAIAWALDVGDLVAWRLWVEDAAVARVEVTPHGPVLRSFNEHPPPAP